MSSNIISEDVLNKICNALERSSFGSGEMIAGILADPEFEMPVEPGIWDISEEENYYGESYYYYRKRRDSYMGSPTWKERRGFAVSIKDDTVEFVLGCGVHGASCIFSRASGDLLEVIPDESPSDCFWGDGDHPDLSRRARREFSQMTQR
jgi:hypothetical protein